MNLINKSRIKKLLMILTMPLGAKIISTSLYTGPATIKKRRPRIYYEQIEFNGWRWERNGKCGCSFEYDDFLKRTKPALLDFFYNDCQVKKGGRAVC